MTVFTQRPLLGNADLQVHGYDPQWVCAPRVKVKGVTVERGGGRDGGRGEVEVHPEGESK